MESRENKILEILKNKNEYVTGKQLAQMLNVSDRSIRNDIGNLNNKYPGIVEASVRYGYKLNEVVLNKSQININQVPQNSKERVNYILKQLLFQKNKINFLSLEEELYVSSSTLKKELKTVEDKLNKYNITLVKKGNNISIEGSEENRRDLCKTLLSDETNGNFINIDSIANLFQNFDLIKVKDILEETFDEFDYRIREENFPLLLTHIGVAISRMLSSNQIKEVKNLEKIKETYEYELVNSFFKKLNKYIQVEVNEYEKALLTTLFIGRRKSDITSDLEKSKELTNLIIEEIKREYDIDLSEDIHFKQGIVIHIQNLFERLSNNISLSNICVSEVKRMYPLVFEVAVFVAEVIEKFTDSNICEDEIGYLAIHIGAAYDRLRVNNYYHALMIQPNSERLGNICVEKINNHFKDRLIIDKVFNYYEEKIVYQYNPDFILTTVPLETKNECPIVNISMFLNEDDEYKIFRTLSSLEKKKLKKTFSSMIEQMISEDFYFYDLEAENSNEVIDKMCSKLLQEKRVKENFKEEVLKREEMAYTSFANGYAIPHALGYYSLKSTIAVAKLKKEIEWGEYKVKFVLMLAIKEEDKNLLKVFFDWFSGICEEQELMYQLLDADTSKKFKEMVLEYGE